MQPHRSFWPLLVSPRSLTSERRVFGFRILVRCNKAFSSILTVVAVAVVSVVAVAVVVVVVVVIVVVEVFL